MESLKFAKGYDKVNPSYHNPKPPPPRRRRRTLIAVSLVLLVTLIVASLVALLIRHNATDSEQSDPSQLASHSAESLRTVCAVTRYPDSCFSSISPLNSPPSNSPFRFFNLSLHASTVEVSRLKDHVGTPSDPAGKDCAELFDDAASQLERAGELIRVGPGEKVLTEMRVNSLATWISAAMTDHDTCLDGLAEMGSTAVDELKMKVQKSEEYLSNTLAILNNIQSLSEKLGLTTP